MLTKKQIKKQLALLGITPSDTVLIHTAFRAVGEVEGGIDGFIDGFCEYLSEGLFLVPTHTWANVNPENPCYDVRRTQPCIGAVPSVAAFRKDGYRSLHPTHSIWGKGVDAAAFLQGEENAGSPGAPGFCWDKLADRNAKILLIGVGHNRNTFLHSVDERAQLSDRLAEKSFDVTIVDQEGNQSVYPFRSHFCSKTNDVSQFYVNFEKAFIALGAQAEGLLGNATVKVVDAKKAQEILLRIYSRATEDLFTDFHDIPESWYLP